MTECDVCKILENKKEFHLIYEDEICFAILHESPAVEGHSLVIPKKHIPIIEEADDKIVEHLFIIANKISTSIFESIGAYGTNILLNNGLAAGQDLPHIVLNVLPRKEKDNINFEWPSRKASENELKTTFSMIKNYSEYIFSGKDKISEIKLKEKEERPIMQTEEDYLVKGLKRIP